MALFLLFLALIVGVIGWFVGTKIWRALQLRIMVGNAVYLQKPISTRKLILLLLLLCIFVPYGVYFSLSAPLVLVGMIVWIIVAASPIILLMLGMVRRSSLSLALSILGFSILLAIVLVFTLGTIVVLFLFRYGAIQEQLRSQELKKILESNKAMDAPPNVYYVR